MKLKKKFKIKIKLIMNFNLKKDLFQYLKYFFVKNKENKVYILKSTFKVTIELLLLENSLNEHEEI